jgi:hypothetical protein
MCGGRRVSRAATHPSGSTPVTHRGACWWDLPCSGCPRAHRYSPGSSPCRGRTPRSTWRREPVCTGTSACRRRRLRSRRLRRSRSRRGHFLLASSGNGDAARPRRARRPDEQPDSGDSPKRISAGCFSSCSGYSAAAGLPSTVLAPVRWPDHVARIRWHGPGGLSIRCRSGARRMSPANAHRVREADRRADWCGLTTWSSTSADPPCKRHRRRPQWWMWQIPRSGSPTPASPEGPLPTCFGDGSVPGPAGLPGPARSRRTPHQEWRR